MASTAMNGLAKQLALSQLMIDSFPPVQPKVNQHINNLNVWQANVPSSSLRSDVMSVIIYAQTFLHIVQFVHSSHRYVMMDNFYDDIQ